MIINIPLQIDEQKMEEVLARDYEGKVLNKITEYIKETIVNKSNLYYGVSEAKVKNGMQNLIEERIDIFLADHEDEIIEGAAKALAEKLARSKKGKTILERIEGEAE